VNWALLTECVERPRRLCRRGASVAGPIRALSGRRPRLGVPRSSSPAAAARRRRFDRRRPAGSGNLNRSLHRRGRTLVIPFTPHRQIELLRRVWPSFLPATLVVRVVRSGRSVCVCLCSHNNFFLFKLPLTYLSQMLNRNLDPYYTILFHNVLLLIAMACISEYGAATFDIQLGWVSMYVMCSSFQTEPGYRPSLTLYSGPN